MDETQHLIQQEFLQKPMSETVDPVVSQQQFRYIQYLKKQVAYFQETLAHERKILERIREEMRRAHVKKRSLELLEEKQRASYNKALAELESKEIEDLVISRLKR